MELANGIDIKRTLDNGFTYYIRKRNVCTNVIKMALTIRVGSICEKEHENGISHLLEHTQMSFYKHNYYPNLKYMARARTNYYETTYFIDCYDGTIALNSCIRILFEILEGNFINEVLLQDVKKDIINEINTCNKTRSDNNQLLSYLLRKSHYLSSLPIGDKKSVNAISYTQLLEYFTMWNSSNIASIAIVGNIDDVHGLENYISRLFTVIKNKNTVLDRTRYPIAAYDAGVHEIEVSDADKRAVEIYFKVEKDKVAENRIKAFERLALRLIESKLILHFMEDKHTANDITCGSIDLDHFYVFFKIEIRLNENVTPAYMITELESFFQRISQDIDDMCIRTVKSELINTAWKFGDDSEGFDDLLFACIDNYIWDEPMYYTYSERRRNFVSDLNGIRKEDIINYIRYVICQCDRLYISKLHYGEAS